MSGLPVTLVVGFSLAFAESGLGLGMVVPGETAVVVLAATMSSTTGLVLLGVAVMAGASMGDHVGYLVGRRYGDALRETRVVSRLGRRHHDRAVELMQQRGGATVFVTRMVPVVRTLTPAVAGASHLAYRRFLPASLAGSALWATVYIGGGSVVAALGHVVQDAFGRASWLVLVLVALTAVPVVLIRAVTGVRPAVAAPDVEACEREFRMVSPTDPALLSR